MVYIKRVIIQPTKEIKTKAKNIYFIGFGVLSYRVLMVGSLQKVTVFHKKEIQQNATLLLDYKKGLFPKIERNRGFVRL